MRDCWYSNKNRSLSHITQTVTMTTQVLIGHFPVYTVYTVHMVTNTGTRNVPKTSGILAKISPSIQVHTHGHKHTLTNIHTQTHTHTTCMYTQIQNSSRHPRTLPHTHTHTHTHTHMHAHMHNLMCIFTFKHL